VGRKSVAGARVVEAGWRAWDWFCLIASHMHHPRRHFFLPARELTPLLGPVMYFPIVSHNTHMNNSHGHLFAYARAYRQRCGMGFGMGCTVPVFFRKLKGGRIGCGIRFMSTL
jgi:hypothetical protein